MQTRRILRTVYCGCSLPFTQQADTGHDETVTQTVGEGELIGCCLSRTAAGHADLLRQRKRRGERGALPAADPRDWAAISENSRQLHPA